MHWVEIKIFGFEFSWQFRDFRSHWYLCKQNEIFYLKIKHFASFSRTFSSFRQNIFRTWRFPIFLREGKRAFSLQPHSVHIFFLNALVHDINIWFAERWKISYISYKHCYFYIALTAGGTDHWSLRSQKLEEWPWSVACPMPSFDGSEGGHESHDLLCNES